MRRRLSWALRIAAPLVVLTTTTAACHRAIDVTREPATSSDVAMAERATVMVETEAGLQPFVVEVARSTADRARGLMFRDHLDEDAGMLFVFERTQMLSFWMKNTRIPLDMLFIDEDERVAGIVENAEPMTESPRRIDRPSRYVLELNGGTCRRRGIAPGAKVRLEGVAGVAPHAAVHGEAAH